MNTAFSFMEFEAVVTPLEWAEAREQLQKDLKLLSCVWCTEQKAEDGERACAKCAATPYMSRVAR